MISANPYELEMDTAYRHQLYVTIFFICMPWTYVPCSAKPNEKRLRENKKTFYRNFRKYW